MGYSWMVLEVETEGRTIANLSYCSDATCKKKFETGGRKDVQECDAVAVGWLRCWDMKLNSSRQGGKGIDCSHFLAEHSISLLYRLLVQLLKRYIKTVKKQGNQPHTLPSPHAVLWTKEYSYWLLGSELSIQGKQRHLTPREDQDFIFFCSVFHWLLPSDRDDCRPATESLLIVLLLASPSLPLQSTGTSDMPSRGWAALRFVNIIPPLFQDCRCFFVSNSKTSYQEAIFTRQYPQEVMCKPDAYVGAIKDYGIA